MVVDGAMSKHGSCWSELKFTGMVQWGRRRQVRFLGRQHTAEIQKPKSNKMTKRKKISIDRWSAERYKMAEEWMLKVMREKGAVYGKPILRAELRWEARKHIGDTGLLDHLLKHMAGKVAPGGVQRFRRRHNAEGVMEYWLESADLADVRRDAGVQDPYWTPPPGWNLGDPISLDHATTTHLTQIKQEILKLKQDMQELLSKKGEEALAIATTPSSCLSSLNSDDCVSLPPMQEIYAELLSKKAKIEEQLKEISLTLSGMEEQLGMLRPNIMSEPEALAYNTTKSSEDRATKIERLKSGFQICKPEGKFVWPNIGVSTPPNPVKPLAERRAVSTATLTHVTGPFSPPPLGTPTTSSTFLNNPTSLNLNHAPL